MALVKFNPVRDLLNFEREVSRIINNFERSFDSDNSLPQEFENAIWSPLSDISEDKDTFKIRLDLPGMKKEDVKINMENNMLSISGERKQEKESDNSKYHRVERVYGKFYRSFTLPESIEHEKIDAEFKDGQLTIIVPKSEKAKPKQLEIKIK
ncbi:MAG TPA: Hsp20/alpha crystallin family protein [Ignavibacteriaceae bacterium]|nr:Hsp20/alpha crystallin family protein [Ignavibacteriaceae bacterium]